MDLHQITLAKGRHDSDGGQLAGAVIQARPRPDLTQGIPFCCLRQERKLLPHALQIGLRLAIVEAADDLIAAFQTVIHVLRICECGGRSREHGNRKRGRKNGFHVNLLRQRWGGQRFR